MSFFVKFLWNVTSSIWSKSLKMCHHVMFCQIFVKDNLISLFVVRASKCVTMLCSVKFLWKITSSVYIFEVRASKCVTMLCSVKFLWNVTSSVFLEWEPQNVSPFCQIFVKHYLFFLFVVRASKCVTMSCSVKFLWNVRYYFCLFEVRASKCVTMVLSNFCERLPHLSTYLK